MSKNKKERVILTLLFMSPAAGALLVTWLNSSPEKKVPQPDPVSVKESYDDGYKKGYAVGFQKGWDEYISIPKPDPEPPKSTPPVIPPEPPKEDPHWEVGPSTRFMKFQIQWSIPLLPHGEYNGIHYFISQQEAQNVADKMNELHVPSNYEFDMSTEQRNTWYKKIQEATK